MRVKRAGFKPSLNLLYALEGALRDCHWQEVPKQRRTQLVTEAEATIALLPAPRGRPAAGPVTTTNGAARDACRRCRRSIRSTAKSTDLDNAALSFALTTRSHRLRALRGDLWMVNPSEG